MSGSAHAPCAPLIRGPPTQCHTWIAEGEGEMNVTHHGVCDAHGALEPAEDWLCW